MLTKLHYTSIVLVSAYPCSWFYQPVWSEKNHILVTFIRIPQHECEWIFFICIGTVFFLIDTPVLYICCPCLNSLVNRFEIGLWKFFMGPQMITFPLLLGFFLFNFQFCSLVSWLVSRRMSNNHKDRSPPYALPNFCGNTSVILIEQDAWRFRWKILPSWKNNRLWDVEF